MIAKISTNSNLKGTIMYNLNKVDIKEAKLLGGGNVIGINFEKINDYLKSFELNLAQNNRTKKPIVHISLNPHPDDKLSDEDLTQIAREYMDKLGFKNQPYFIFKHEDIDRHHIHIVTTNVDHKGVNIRKGRNFRESKMITNSLEAKYKLNTSNIRKSRVKEIYIPKKINLKAKNLTPQIKSLLKIANAYAYTSIGEYKAFLELYNVELKEITGMSSKGVPYRGAVYSIKDDQGNRQRNPIKASLLGKEASLSFIENKITSNKEKKISKTYQTYLKTIITNAKENCNGNREEFRKSLEEKGIIPLFRFTDQGRIYGATFIDHKNKSILNGSKIGKEFSANNFENLFKKSDDKTPQKTLTNDSKEDEPFEFLPVNQDDLYNGPSVQGGITFKGSAAGSASPGPKKKKRKKNL